MQNEEQPDQTGRCPKCAGTMTGKHCLACGFSWPRAKPVKPHNKLEPSAGDELIALLKRCRITLDDATEKNWRCAKQRTGTIASLGFAGVKPLLTDGIVAWFELGNGELFYGHLANWEADATERAAGAPRKPTRKAQAIASALDED